MKKNKNKSKVPTWFFSQSAILPYRWKDDQLEILLITNHRGKHYVIPKGVIEPTMTAVDSAAKEAFEEAGIRGVPATKSLGEYKYKKWGGRCRVQVYPMEVREVLKKWPEQKERSRKWVSTEKAISLLKHKNLRPLIIKWSSSLCSGKKEQ
ncbi:MAG: NUDIX domain-containing protein [Xanthomonadaceae bacterium]|nr:NUDIX domain-containing protein [Xanthomonadaceae bacterium]